MKKTQNKITMKNIFKFRGFLMIPPIVFIVLCTWDEIEENWLSFGLGGATFALGLALRIWAQTHIHHRLKMKKILTTTGPYAYVRNPLYIANTIMLVATCMLAELFWFVPVQILYCAIVYTFVVRFEENRLYQKYGSAYLNYAHQVPRWLPKLRSLSIKETNINRYLIPSIVAEVHNLLLVVPFIVKEMLLR
jgi:protein-S-isoprenylcysteine O-methyltransferase Ste14